MATVTFGVSTGSAVNWSAGSKVVRRAPTTDIAAGVIYSGISVGKILLHATLAAAAAKVVGVVYADNNGVPGALLGVSTEKVGIAVGVNELVFPTPAVVGSPSAFHYGWLSDTQLQIKATSSSASQTRHNTDAYADGPTDPFGSPTTTTWLPAVQAETEATVSGIITVTQVVAGSLIEQQSVMVTKIVVGTLLSGPLPLVITNVAPNSGPVAGGTRVRVTYTR